MRELGLPRDALFLTSKAGPGEMGFAGALRAAGESLRRLGTDYLDLYLLHWPGCARTPLGSRRHRESRCGEGTRVRGAGRRARAGDEDDRSGGRGE